MNMKAASSRRHLLKAGLATCTVLPFGGVLSQEKKEEHFWDKEFDVIVVGSGVAGLTAGITAAENGAATLIVEKMGEIGGSSRISQCDMAIVGSPLQKKLGIQDKPEWLAADMQKVSGGLTDPEYALTIAKGTSALFNFMVEHGVIFNDTLMHFGGHSVKRTVYPVGGGKGIIRPLYNSFASFKNSKLITRCKAENVIYDGDGRAIGLKVRTNYLFNPLLDSEDTENKTGSVKYFKANKGIVFASGGYCRDNSIVSAEVPYLKGISSNAQIGATGSGLRALLEAGAYPVHLSLFRFSFPISYTDICWGMYVDPSSGLRFVDEGGNRDKISMAILEQKKKNGNITPVLIYDSAAIKNFHDQRRLKRGLALKNTCGGNIYKFDSLEELAKAYGIPVVALKEQAQRYNKMLDELKDTEFNKDMKAMKGAGVRKAPFYAMQAMPFIAYTAGGAKITPQAQVISARTFKPIKGLYAAGEAAGGIHGANRLTCCSVIDCGVFGMIAGTQVSKQES